MPHWCMWCSPDYPANKPLQKLWLIKQILVCVSGKHRNSCKVPKLPSSRSHGKDRSPISDVIIKVVKKMTIPVTVLHVTPMDAYRSDAHVGTWSDNPSVPDCSHWCLPGVPDTWNEILLLHLLSKNGAPLQWTIEVACFVSFSCA